MYGHGIFVPVSSLGSSDGDNDGAAASGMVTALAAAAASLTSPRSILLVCPSAPSRPGCAATQAIAPAAAAAACRASDSSTAEDSKVVPGSLGFRDTLFLGMYAMWTRSQAGPDADGDAAHVAWVRSCAASLEPYTVGLYVNEVMHDEPGQVRSSYEELSYMRLQALKQKFDPSGLLRAL
ncbi:hypothetical protein Vretimale_11978 [Volvox reticuliferus]|nr:hypothetical protein Vretifemale_11474 [Volvox reticuliferus]GIM07979.1 hypothetical protein Vretimale_11978 [Volvox reticuliferus]